MTRHCSTSRRAVTVPADIAYSLLVTEPVTLQADMTFSDILLHISIYRRFRCELTDSGHKVLEIRITPMPALFCNRSA
jgi:hypothetical protein